MESRERAFYILIRVAEDGFLCENDKANRGNLRLSVDTYVFPVLYTQLTEDISTSIFLLNLHASQIIDADTFNSRRCQGENH